MYYLPTMLYRTKSPTPKSKIVAPAAPKVAPVIEPILIKITLIPGLKATVLDELAKYPELNIAEQGEDKLFLDYIPNFQNVLLLRGVLNAYVIRRGEKYNPFYISNHKATIGDLVEIALGRNKVEDVKPRKSKTPLTPAEKSRLNKIKQESLKTPFKSFRLRCAGSDTKEVKEIQNYITTTYKLNNTEDADMEIYINKPSLIWEVGVRLSPRPLSLRNYRVANIKGGLNPTIAYAMNTFCNLETAKSYLNVFSGSGTLLIEAGISNPDLKLIGFDIDGKSNALAILNIKKAGLIKQIHLQTADIYNKPHLGKFDVIASDLPFGMQISSKVNLDSLYGTFVKYCEETLNADGTLVICTTEYKVLEKALEDSKFDTIKTLDLVVSTSVQNIYLYPRIFVCKFK